MSKTFKFVDLSQNHLNSLELGNNDLKEVVLSYPEPNNGIRFEGNSNINVENSNEVVIGTLTQFMGPVTIMQSNSLKKPLAKDARGEIPNISKYVATSSYIGRVSHSQYPKSPIKFWRKYKNCSAYMIAICILVILIIVGLSLSINVSYHELKTMESSTVMQGKQKNSTEPDSLFRNTVNYVMISNSGGRQCHSTDKCEFTVHYHQNFHSHSVKYGSPNFGHNFFIGGDGYFYLDQGWNVKNKVSDNNIEFCFMGNYTRDTLNPEMISCAKGLITFGIKLGVIAEDYILVAHNQTYNNTDSPGKNAYAEIKTWPHWKDGLFPDAKGYNKLWNFNF